MTFINARRWGYVFAITSGLWLILGGDTERARSMAIFNVLVAILFAIWDNTSKRP